MNTVAKLWHDAMLDDGRIEVAGHAYAGTRGVSTVEVSIDGGDTGTDAELSEPLPGDDVWRQWRYVFEPTGPRGRRPGRRWNGNRAAPGAQRVVPEWRHRLGVEVPPLTTGSGASARKYGVATTAREGWNAVRERRRNEAFERGG